MIHNSPLRMSKARLTAVVRISSRVSRQQQTPQQQSQQSEQSAEQEQQATESEALAELDQKMTEQAAEQWLRKIPDDPGACCGANSSTSIASAAVSTQRRSRGESILASTIPGRDFVDAQVVCSRSRPKSRLLSIVTRCR